VEALDGISRENELADVGIILKKVGRFSQFVSQPRSETGYSLPYFSSNRSIFLFPSSCLKVW
jgi:hypothetical protein